MTGMYNQCYSLIKIPELDIHAVYGASSISYMLGGCNSLVFASIKGVKSNLDLSGSPLLGKNYLLYIINNEAATSAITIKLAQHAYDRLASNKDIVAALNEHPKITLAV
jgi:hypothetical protein